MATYLELHGLDRNSVLINKISVALIIEAHALVVGTPTAEEVSWVSKALRDPRSEAQKALRFVLAANKDATTAQILEASDASIQTQVALVVSALVAAS